MTYKFYYIIKGSDFGLPFEAEASNIYEALRELASYFARVGFSLDYIRAHYFVTNDKGRTSIRVFKPSFESFLRDNILAFSLAKVIDETL